MSSFTKDAIKKTLLQLLNERPLAQITVKDIVQTCGINRNTFYYYFEDLPSLLQEIVTDEADRLIEQYPTLDSMEQCLEVAIQFALQNRKAVLHLYNSGNRDLYEHYLMKVCEIVITSYVQTLTKGHAVRKEDRELVIRLYKCECFGIILEWMSNGMKEDILQYFHRWCDLRQGFAEELLQRCLQ